MDDVKVIELMEKKTDFKAIPLRRLYKELCDISHLCDDLENLRISGLQPILQLVKIEKQKREEACKKRIKNTSSKRLMAQIRHIPPSPSPNKIGEEKFRLGPSEWRSKSENGEEKDFYDLVSEIKLKRLWKLLKKESFPNARDVREEIERRLNNFIF
jgi:hypothetical protein